jgi:class 3 adenylate cyclase
MSIWHTALVDMRSTAPAVMSPPAQRGHRHTTASVPRRDRDMSDSYRREVVILFADITGFTQLAETLDPEVVYLRVSPLLDALVLRVHQHGGQVQQVLGDGFMAAFGLTTPVATWRNGQCMPAGRC